MKNIDLTKESVKITGATFFYNKAIQNELNNITTLSQIQAVLNLWRMQMRRISLEEKIILFKSLAMSKITYLYLLTSAPNNTVEELIKIQKNFTASKIKHSMWYGLPKW